MNLYKPYLILIFLLASTLICNAKLKFDDVIGLGLNVLVIETENDEIPSCEYVDAPDGSIGKGITNATKVSGSLSIFSPAGDILYESGPYLQGESGMTIKIRGNTSAYASKKPYKIKLQKKDDLLFRDNKDLIDKNWVLLNDNQLKLHLGFELSRILEEDWTPQGQYVNVIINNEYKGLYYLVESIEQNEKARINVSGSGFIVEHDAYWWNENGAYLLSKFNPLLNYTFKYPDYEDISYGSLKKTESTLRDYEESLAEGTYPELIDIDSFAKWIMGHDILGTQDGGGANLYLSKYDDSPSSLIKAGPLWDFDTIELNEDQWSGPHTAMVRFDSFFVSKDTPFMKSYLNLWNAKGEEIYEGILDVLEDLKDSEKWEGYKASSTATSLYVLWGPAVDPVEVAETSRQWFEDRFGWLKSQLEDFQGSSDDAGIGDTVAYPDLRPKDVYNLQGVKIISNASPEQIRTLKTGVYIIGEAKVFIK